MTPIDAFWHVAGFLAPAIFTGAISASLARLLWRGGLHGMGWWRLCGWTTAAGVAVLVGGLVVTGRDGRMATYAAMVCACALSLWCLGLPKRRS